MADNTTLPGDGEVYASDDIGSVNYQRVKIGVGPPGTAVDLSHAAPMPILDLPMSIAMGLRPGYSQINKFGENPYVGSGDGLTDLWGGTGSADFSTSADIDSISSANDTVTQDITITGLNADWDEVVQTITVTGRTRKALDTALIRVTELWNVGSSELAGAVYVYPDTPLTNGIPSDASKIRARIGAGENRSLMCLYTVPAGRTAYFMSWYAGIEGGVNAYATLSWWARQFGGLFQVQSRSDVTLGSPMWQYRYSVPAVLPEKTDIIVRCDKRSSSGPVVGGFDLILKDN